MITLVRAKKYIELNKSLIVCPLSPQLVYIIYNMFKSVKYHHMRVQVMIASVFSKCKFLPYSLSNIHTIYGQCEMLIVWRIMGEICVGGKV